MPGRLEFLGLLRDGAATLAVALKARGAALAPDTPHRWGLAVYEAATNVVRHGYAGGGDESITLGVHVEDDRVLFRLVDHGAAHDAWARGQLAQPEPGSEGGYGMLVIAGIMDDVRYRRDPAGYNELCLVACLPGTADSA